MRTLKDSKGTDWQVELNLLAARRIEKADWSAIYDKPVKLLNAQQMDPDFFTGLLTNTSCLAFMLWIMVNDEAIKREVDEDEFCRRLTGDVLFNAKKVVWEEIVDFFPEHRTTLSRLIDNYVKVHQKIDQGLASRMPQAEDQIDKLLDESFKVLDRNLSQMNGLGATSG